jgi:hypothetical protein
MPIMACPDSTPVRTNTRDANLCVNPSGCVATPFCPLFLPSCNEGYTLSSWTGATGCLTFACDPAFIH